MDWSLNFVLSSCNLFPSLHGYYFANPNDEGVRNWIANHISKFHDNATVNESGIIVLLRWFWVFAGKKSYDAKGISLSSDMFYNSQRWDCLEMSSESGAQISQRSNDEWVRDCRFSEIGLVVFGKKRGFWEEKRRKRNWREEEAS